MSQLYVRANINSVDSRAFFILSIKSCELGDLCEKDPVKINTFFQSFYVEMSYLTAQIDWEILGQKPVKIERKSLFSFQIETDRF
jgi:hypothetical protein